MQLGLSQGEPILHAAGDVKLTMRATVLGLYGPQLECSQHYGFKHILLAGTVTHDREMRKHVFLSWRHGDNCCKSDL